MSAAPPTGIDINVLLSTILGGIITISGSLAVAAVYIRNQNKVQRKRHLREMIQQDYFNKCLNPTLGALSEYGMNTVFALFDASVLIGRYIKHEENPDDLERKLKEVSNRPLLTDLISHNFTHITEYLPMLQKFGTTLYVSVIRTVQFYSSIAADGTSYTVLKKGPDSSLPEVSRSLGVLAMIVERIMIYLEKRFINLRDFFLTKEIENYDDFSKVFLEEDYSAFLSIIQQYIDGLTKLMDAMKSEKGEDRASASMGFSKWLADNMDNNPLDNKTRTEETKKTQSETLPTQVSPSR